MPSKIILDTNLWISFLISRRFKELDDLFKNNEIELIFSLDLIEEFIEVVRRPKFKKYFSSRDIEDVLKCFDYYGELVEIKSDVKICRDSADNFLLNLSIDSKANYLLTGDSDLLVLKEVEDTKIITFKEFLELVK